MRAITCALALFGSVGCGEVVTEPEVATVTISPAAPKTADDLVAAVDIDTATLQWTRNGEVRSDVTGAQVDAVLTGKGETWGVDVLSSSGKVIGHDEVVIGNSAPAAFDVDIQIGMPGADVPCAIVAQAIDDDNDTVSYSATWTRNGVAYSSATMTMFAGDTIPAVDHVAGDQFECTVTATDGTEMVTAHAGARMMVPNGAPPNGTIQMFTTPAATTLRIEAAGGRGATQGPATVNGARMIGTFSPSPGSVLQILVGQASTSLGGGGGTFVMSGTMPMVIAGGGGAVFGTSNFPVAESSGRIVTSGGTAGSIVRADNGQGGRTPANTNSGGGGGLMGNGGGPVGGKSFTTGAAGGGTMTENQWGGYGGGGGRAGLYGQGGGGGYSGGSCGDTFDGGSVGTWVGCGGGGSINMGIDQDNTAGANAGPGYVKITW